MQIADLSPLTVRTSGVQSDISRLQTRHVCVLFHPLAKPQPRWKAPCGRFCRPRGFHQHVVLFNALFDVPTKNGQLLPQMKRSGIFLSTKSAENDTEPFQVAAIEQALDATKADSHPGRR